MAKIKAPVFIDNYGREITFVFCSWFGKRYFPRYIPIARRPGDEYVCVYPGKVFIELIDAIDYVEKDTLLAVGDPIGECEVPQIKEGAVKA